MPVELVCHIDEFRGVSAVNHEGLLTLYREPQGTMLRHQGASVDQLFRILLDKTAGLDREPAAAEDFIDSVHRVRVRRSQPAGPS